MPPKGSENEPAAADNFHGRHATAKNDCFQQREAVQTISKNLTIDLDGGESVSAVLAGPRKSPPALPTGLVLAHGAGNDMHNPLIVAVAERLAAEGFAALRFNFLYKEKGRKSPDSQARLEHAWQRAWETMRTQKLFPLERIVAVGKSMGGRVASQMAAAGRLPAAALIFLGYPLHAPGKPDQLRDEHLYRIQAPMLFFAGTRDPFCNRAKLDGMLDRLTTPYDLEVIEGGNHSFGLPRTDARTDSDIHDRIAAKCLQWLHNRQTAVASEIGEA